MMASFVFFLRHVVGVLAPFVDEGLHVGRERGVELNVFPGTRVYEPECLGMEGLTGEQPETVGYELTVFRIDGAFADFRPVISFIIEQRVSDPVEMYPYLVGPSRFQTALDYRDIAETFQYPEMCDGSLAPVPIREDPEPHPVRGIASYIPLDGALVFPYVPPDYGHISPVDGVDEELFRKVELGFLVFCHD